MADQTPSPTRGRSRGLLPGNVPTWSAPWLTCLSAPPVAFVAHEIWATDQAMHTGLGGLAVGITAVTWATWGRRHEHTRALATAFAAGVTGWTAVAADTPMTSHALWDTWMLGSAFLSGAWNIRHVAHNAPHEGDKPSERRDGLFAAIGGALENAKVRRTKERAGRLEADIELQPGQVNTDAQQQAGTVASRAGIGTDQVTVVPSRRNARKLKLVFQDTENLREAVVWPGPGKLGRSIADAPLHMGLRADGSLLAWWIVGNDDPQRPRQLSHTLVTGVSGAGKTETLNTAIILIRETSDCVPVVGDPAKFPQSFGNVADAIAIAAKGKQQVSQLIRNISPTIEYRAELLGNLVRSDGTTGYNQWVPECYTLHGVPAVFLDIEEATDVLGASDDEYDEAVRKARSVGIHLVASLQSAHHGNIDRKTRGQFAQSICHGCRETYEAKFALSPATLDAGADPTKWGNDFAGSVYGELAGTDPSTWAMEARVFAIDRVAKRKVLEASKANGHWAVLDPGTAMHLGRGITMPDQKITAMLPTVTPDPVEPQVSEPDDAPADLTRVVVDGEEIDVTAPLAPPASDTPFARPEERRKPSTEQARALVAERIDALEAEGKTEITFADLADILEATGRRRNWIYDELQRLCAEGRLSAGSAGRAPYRLRGRVLVG